MEKVMNLNFIISLLIISAIPFAQVSIDSTPKSFSLEEEIVIPTRTLPTFNIQDFIDEDENEIRLMDVKPYRFANPIAVNFNMENSGVWTILEDGSSIWRLRITSEDAFSLNIIYDIFDIPKGAEFFVYSEDREMILGAFTDYNHKPHGGFSTAPVIGDKIILEYNEPVDAPFRGNISTNIIYIKVSFILICHGVIWN